MMIVTITTVYYRIYHIDLYVYSMRNRHPNDAIILYNRQRSNL